ncbi:unnamed protein product, partial [Urochloa humidicola]
LLIPVDCPKASFATFPIYTAGGSPRRRRGVLLAGNLRCFFPILWHGFHGDPIYCIAKQLIPSTRSVSRRQLGDGPLPLRYGSALPAGCLPQRSGAAPPTRQRGGCGCSILCSSINELATLSGAAGRRWRQVPSGRPRCDPEQVVLACSSPPPSMQQYLEMPGVPHSCLIEQQSSTKDESAPEMVFTTLPAIWLYHPINKGLL